MLASQDGQIGPVAGGDVALASAGVLVLVEASLSAVLVVAATLVSMATNCLTGSSAFSICLMSAVVFRLAFTPSIFAKPCSFSRSVLGQRAASHLMWWLSK